MVYNALYLSSSGCNIAHNAGSKETLGFWPVMSEKGKGKRASVAFTWFLKSLIGSLNNKSYYNGHTGTKLTLSGPRRIIPSGMAMQGDPSRMWFVNQLPFSWE